ncbi:MAG: hypothetical protein KAR57_03530 [Bacteroidales bacterium]|nr:hypothetical protein [Bacteroidales bacterium]
MKLKSVLFAGSIAAIIYFIGLYLDNHLLRVVFKPIPVVALLLLLKPSTRFRKYIFVGLVFSLLGDIFLEVSDDLFVFGLLAFLSGHVAYIIAFVGRNRQKAILPLVFILVYGIAIY